MNTINDYFSYLFSLERTKMKYSLDNISKMTKYFGNPQNKFRTIHIAGTNGKGGTASFLASIFKEHGFKTGLFTSPHLINFNERIRVNGHKINNEYIKYFVDNNLRYFKRKSASFFEISTLLAFNYFQEKNVDIAIIETGLGGRLDSTNIINPEMSIITQIDIDHTDFLGKSKVSIAKEKAEIIKPESIVIISDSNKHLKPIFNKKITTGNIFYNDEIIKISRIKLQSGRTNYKLNINIINVLKFKPSDPISFPLYGNFHIKNSSTAVLAYILFCSDNMIDINESVINKGLENVIINSGYHCRFEILEIDKIKIILDVAHNLNGIKQSVINFNNLKIKPITITGLMNDKDYKSIIKELVKISNIIIFTKPENKRAIEPDKLYKYALSQDFVNKHFYFTNSVEDAIMMSRVLRSKKDALYFTGSFYLISEVIKNLNLRKYFN